MQIKHFFIATSIALPAIAAPLPNHNTKIVIVNKMPPVVDDSDGHSLLHKRIDDVTPKWKCDDDDSIWQGFGRNLFGLPPNCAENDWNSVDDWKPSRWENQGQDDN